MRYSFAWRGPSYSVGLYGTPAQQVRLKPDHIGDGDLTVAVEVRRLKGRATFEGELEEGYRACLWSRLASRTISVMVPRPSPLRSPVTTVVRVWMVWPSLA